MESQGHEKEITLRKREYPKLKPRCISAVRGMPDGWYSFMDIAKKLKIEVIEEEETDPEELLEIEDEDELDTAPSKPEELENDKKDKEEKLPKKI